MKRLVIIDGKSVFYRGYYAMGALSMSDGTPTGGVYGFAAIAMELVRQLAPTKVVVAWDSRSSTAKRKAIYGDYKAGRVKPGDDFYTQIPLLEELVRALGWSFVEVPEYEADDIIGTLARQANLLSGRSTSSDSPVRGSSMPNTAPLRASNLPRISSQIAAFGEGKTNVPLDDQWETYIVSSDLDMLQVVDENTRMYRVLKGFTKLEELDVAAVEAKYGIRKAQFLDLKALKGDASDNIPGVPGVGEKTAVKLLNQYGSLAGIYENLDKITGAVKGKLEAGRESAEMSYRLATIMTDAPVSLTEMPDLVVDRERIVAALKKLEFRSLIGRFLKALDGVTGAGAVNGGAGGVADGGAGADMAAVGGVGVGMVADEGAKWAQEKPQEASEKANGYDTAVEGKNASEGEFGASNGKTTASQTAKMAEMGQQRLEIPHFLPDGTLVSWDVKDLMHKNAEIAAKVLAGTAFWDLGQGRFLLNPLERNLEYTDEEAEYRRQKAEFAESPKLNTIFTQFDLPLIPVLYRMEEAGMLIDREYFREMREEFTKEVERIEHKIYSLAGKEFNVNSPVQLSEVLFTDLGLSTKGIKKTQRGYSTGVKELDKLEGQHEIIGAIKEYREMAKLLTTYITPLPELADKDGRVHTTFNQNVTATGRLSSTNPNLQNIPVRTEEGRRIRTGFVAGLGKALVSADYSQFELRLAAALAGDEALIKDFNDDLDVHTKTAAEAFGVPMSEVTKAQRRAAKVINFGILYGMSVRGLATAADMSYEAAKEFIDHYFELRKPIKVYLEKVLEQARSRGYVETLYGRRRPTPDVLSSNFIVRTGAERAAQNMPIQGTEADLMKKAMLGVQNVLGERFGAGEARMVMQVHDSLIVECDEGVAEEVGEILKREMESVAPELAVKLRVDVTRGANWGEL